MWTPRFRTKLFKPPRAEQEMSSGDVLPPEVLSAALAALPRTAKKKKAEKSKISKDARKVKKPKKKATRLPANPALPTVTVIPADHNAPPPVPRPIVQFLNEHRFGQRLLRDSARSIRPRRLKRPPAASR